MAQLQRALDVPEDGQLAKMPSTSSRKLRERASRAATPCSWRSDDALRKAGELDEAMQAFERAAALAPMATGDDSPNAQIAEIALEKKDTRARHHRLQALIDAGLRQRRTPRASWPR